MEALSDWSILKAEIEGRTRIEKTRSSESRDFGDVDFVLNKTDVLVIGSLLSGEKKLKELREEAGRSRVSVYMSLKKLKRFSIIEEEKNVVKLREDMIPKALRNLYSSGFDFDSLVGERLLVLNSLLGWKSIEQIAVECNISQPAVYKYLQELRIFLDKKGRLYKIKDDEHKLKELLYSVKECMKAYPYVIQSWSSPVGSILKTKKRIDGSLTAFSRFRDFGVNYSSEYFYYFVPKRELSVGEIFVHSLKCADSSNYSIVQEFYLRNSGLIDNFIVDELAMHFDVVDSWLNLQSKVADLLEKEGKLCSMDLSYLSPENVFFSNSISKECGSILKCESILKREKLCWDMLFKEYVIQQKDPDFRWRALISRLQILEKRIGVKIPILKKLNRVYLEKAILSSLHRPKTVDELEAEVGVSGYQLRNTLAGMVGRGLIKKVGEKPIRFMLP